MMGEKEKGCGDRSSGSASLTREDRARRRGGANPNDQLLGPCLLHMAHNGGNLLNMGDTESEDSDGEGRIREAERLQREADARVMRELEVGIERRLRDEFERAAQLREERERTARIWEERERAAQDAVTTRRGGAPAQQGQS